MMEVLQYPHPALLDRAKEIPEVTPEIIQLAADMFQLMKASGGIGLAAPQVGASKRLIVGMGPGWQFALVNPVIVKQSEQTRATAEGCLSFKGKGNVMVRRPKYVTVAGITLQGQPIKQKTHGLMATCIQHEIDHLDGITLADHGIKWQTAVADAVDVATAVRRIVR